MLLVGVFAPAALEELVFRRILPSHFASAVGEARWSSNAIISVILPAIVFAASHAQTLGASFSASGVRELSRLFVAAILYSAIVSLSGLWLAIGIHAGINTRIALGPRILGEPASPAELVVALVIALVVLQRAGTLQQAPETEFKP